MGKIETKISTIEFKNDIDQLSLVEKIEILHSLDNQFNEKTEKYEKLRIEFLEKIQEFKKMLPELRKELSE